MRKITVCDITLRQLAEENRAELLFREKTAIAACVDAIGADRIELPAVKREKEDKIIYKTIASSVKNCALAVPVGYTSDSVEAAWECVSGAKEPWLQVVLPVSTAQMEYGFRMKEKAMLEKLAELTSLSKRKCESTEFIARDASRADRAFLINACRTAVENGAVCVTLCDDAGTLLPEEAAALVEDVKKEIRVPVFVSLADTVSMAVASAVAAVKAGADGVKTSMTGENVLLTEKFACAAAARGASLGFETALLLTELNRDIKSVIKGINHSVSENRLKNGTEDTADIFLDIQSTIADTGNAVRLLGYELSDEDTGRVHKALLQVCEHKSSVGAKELEALIATNAMQAPSAYHLLSFNATCSGSGSSMAQVTLEYDNEKLTGVAVGDGPIDSAFRAIEQCVGYHYELDAFEIQAVTEGKEALGSTIVRLRNNGRLYSGTGISTDIVGASIRAYINALNKIVFEEN